MLERKNYNNKRDSNTGQKSKIKSYRSLEEEDKEEMADLAAECGD